MVMDMMGYENERKGWKAWDMDKSKKAEGLGKSLGVGLFVYFLFA